METQLNKIILTGILGVIRSSVVGGIRIYKMTIATSFSYKSVKDRTTVIETTWSDITAFEGKGVNPSVMETLSKGSRVKVTGRLRRNRYTSSDGEDRFSYEILASRVEALSSEGDFPPQVSG